VNSTQQSDDPTARLVLLIIDEISLVSADVLGTISDALRGKRCVPKPFGGLAVLFCGDFYQLPPVSGLALYDTSDAAATAPACAQVGFDVWQSLTHVVTLKTNYRAAADPAFIELLQRLRSKTVVSADLAALGRRRVRPDQLPPLDAATAWFTNNDVDATNCTVVHFAAAAAHRTVYRLSAAVRPEKRGPPVNANGPAHAGWTVGSRKSDRTDLGYSHLDVYVGCPVTLYVNNKLTKYLVARGSRGCVVGAFPPLATAPSDEVQVLLPTGATRPVKQLHALPTVLFVLVPGSTVRFQGLPQAVFPVQLRTSKIQVHGHAEPCHVSQFPVKLNFAWTGHKLQGKTEPQVTLGCTNRILNWNYTAISRIRALKDLYVLKGVKLTLDVMNHKTDQYDMLVAEMDRLQSLSAATLAAFSANPDNTAGNRAED
jgi:hypothetical protein